MSLKNVQKRKQGDDFSLLFFYSLFKKLDGFLKELNRESVDLDFFTTFDMYRSFDEEVRSISSLSEYSMSSKFHNIILIGRHLGELYNMLAEPDTGFSDKNELIIIAADHSTLGANRCKEYRIAIQ